MTAGTQRYVADTNAAKTSGPERAVQAIMADSVAKGIPMTETEAMKIYYAMQPSIYGVNQRSNKTETETRQEIGEKVDKLLGIGGDQLSNMMPTQLQKDYQVALAEGNGVAFRANVLKQQLLEVNLSPVGAPAGATGGSSTGPTEAQLIQLRASNPNYTDAQLIERFKTIN